MCKETEEHGLVQFHRMRRHWWKTYLESKTGSWRRAEKLAFILMIMEGQGTFLDNLRT